MSGKLKFRNVILCDYVAEGARGKPILIGVFSGDVLVSSLPVALNLGLYLEYLSQDAGPVDMGIHFVVGGKEVAKARMHADSTKEGETVTLVIPMFGFNITAATRFEIFASRSGYKKTQLLSKTISVAPLTT